MTNNRDARKIACDAISAAPCGCDRETVDTAPDARPQA